MTFAKHIMLALLAAAPARADLVSHAQVGFGDVGLTMNEQFGTLNAAAALSYSSPGTFEGTASCQAAYGILNTRVNLGSVNAGYVINRGQAESGFFDLLTISGPTGTGFIVYEYTVTGSASGNADAHLFLYHQGDPDEELAGEVTGDGVFTSPAHNVVFGQPFRTGLVLSTIALIGQGESGESVADLRATLTRISVYDAQMAPISGFSISSESGTQYPLPSPGSAWTLACGGLILRRRRPR